MTNTEKIEHLKNNFEKIHAALMEKYTSSIVDGYIPETAASWDVKSEKIIFRTEIKEDDPNEIFIIHFFNSEAIKKRRLSADLQYCIEMAIMQLERKK